MALETQDRIGGRHAATVVDYLYEGASGIRHYDADLACACVHGVLHQFLDYRCGALHNLPGRDHVCDLGRQNLQFAHFA